MKKVQLLLMSFVVATMAFAQPAKGDILLGGSLNFGMGSSSNTVGGTKTDGPKTFQFGIQPRVGYFLSDKIVAGVDLGFMTSSSKIEVSNVETVNSMSAFGGGIFARHYVMPTERFGFFTQANVTAMAGSSKVKVGGTETDGPKSLDLNVGVSPGLAFYVNTRIALEAQYGFLGYNSYSTKEGQGSSEVKTNEGNFGLNLNPNTFKFGISVLF